MRTCIFDLESFSLHADTGILLCAVIKEYHSKEKPIIIRADQFPNWDKHRSDSRPIVRAIIEAMDGYDIYVAHNGQYFDKRMITSYALRYNLDPFLRFSKFVDPVMLCRKHLRLARNNLQKLLDWLQIDESKTDIKWESWMKAAIDGDRRSMNYIVEHCVVDVIALEKAYDKMRCLVKGIDEKGSYF